MSEREKLVKVDAGVERLVHHVIGAAIRVHQALGPGLLESVYREAMKLELSAQGIPFEANKEIVISYRDQVIGRSYADLLVGGVLVVELKAIRCLGPAQMSQVLHYLHAGKYVLGLLLNFHEATLAKGIQRVIA